MQYEAARYVSVLTPAGYVAKLTSYHSSGNAENASITARMPMEECLLLVVVTPF